MFCCKHGVRSTIVRTRTWCRESVTGWEYRHQRGRGVPPWASPEKISLGSVQRQTVLVGTQELEEVVVIRERSSHVRDPDGVHNETIVSAFEEDLERPSRRLGLRKEAIANTLLDV